MVVFALLLLGCQRPVPTEPAAKQSPTAWTSPPDARVWYLKAVAAEVDGDLAEAERALEWVTRLDRRSPWPWMARGRLAEVGQDPEGALEAYQKAWDKAPIPEAWEAMVRVAPPACLGAALGQWASGRPLPSEVPVDDPGCATTAP